MSRVVLGARFQTAGRMYFFEPGQVEDVAINEWVIVQTELGQDAAKVQILPTDSPLVQVDPDGNPAWNARLSSYRDAFAPGTTSETQSTVEGVCKAVQAWLASVIEPDAPPGAAVTDS